MEIEEAREDAVTAEVAHTRRIVVENAPALFYMPCGDPACREGGHDVTTMMMRGLESKQTLIEGEDACYGRTGTSNCGRILRFKAYAEYEG